MLLDWGGDDKRLLNLDGSGSGGNVDGGHRLNMSGQGGGVYGTTGLGHIGTLMSGSSHHHSGGNMRHMNGNGGGHGHIMNHSRSMGGYNGSRSQNGPVGAMDSPGSMHSPSMNIDGSMRSSHNDSSWTRYSGIGQSMSSHLTHQRNDGGVDAHGKGQGESNSQSELRREKKI